MHTILFRGNDTRTMLLEPKCPVDIFGSLSCTKNMQCTNNQIGLLMNLKCKMNSYCKNEYINISTYQHIHKCHHMRVEVHVVRSELLDIASSYAFNIGNSVRCVMPRDNDKQNRTCELERRSTTTNKHNCTTLLKSVLAWRQKSTPVITASL